MEELREVMRKWVTGVALVSVEYGKILHGMTVNSLASVSLDPPRIVVTLANDTRTYKLVSESGFFGVTLLKANQQKISDRFAGKISDEENRFSNIEILRLIHDIPVLRDGLGVLACRVVHVYGMPASTLFVGEVMEARIGSDDTALVYGNRKYHHLEL